VKVTAILLADAASVREGLLHVLGAGITRLARDPLPARLDVALALMLRADDLDDLMAVHNMEVTITESAADETARPIARALMELGPPPGQVHPGPNMQVPVVVPIQPVPVPSVGTYRIMVHLDGDEAGSYEFEVVKASELIPAQPTSHD
jgi:hypothetical protein